jgi:hypothetical protein
VETASENAIKNAVYILAQEIGGVVVPYVGKTTDLTGRMRAHQQVKEVVGGIFKVVIGVDGPPELLDEIEQLIMNEAKRYVGLENDASLQRQYRNGPKMGNQRNAIGEKAREALNKRVGRQCP